MTEEQEPNRRVRSDLAGIRPTEREPDTSNHPIPRADHHGTVILALDREIRCYVLDDGQRVLSLRGLAALFGYTGDWSRQRGGLQWPRFLRQKALWQRLRITLGAGCNLPFVFAVDDETQAIAFRADLLLDVCDAWLAAALAGELRPNQMPMADAARQISHAASRVGLEALIDEATGYQVEREAGSLQAAAIRFLVQARHRPWAKRFPDEFFTNLFKIYEIAGDALGPRPHYVAHLINFMIYERVQSHDITPGFDEVNAAEGGRRPRKNHQHMTREGLASLSLHIQIVTNMLGNAKSRYEFEETLRRTFPTDHEQLDLGLSYIIETLANDDEPPDSDG